MMLQRYRKLHSDYRSRQTGFAGVVKDLVHLSLRPSYILLPIRRFGVVNRSHQQRNRIS